LNNRLHTLQTSKSNNVLASLAYTYEYNGNVASITDNLNPSMSKTYYYDDLNRLQQAQSTSFGGAYFYDYDTIGNMTLKEGLNYTYSATGARPHAVQTTSDGAVYSYDANGNMTREARDRLFSFGNAGDIPVMGDWTGDGKVKVGVFRSGTWYLDMNGNGVWEPGIDATFTYGSAGDIPVTGDWNNSGTTKIGVYKDGVWHIDMTGTRTWSSATIYSFGVGLTGAQPVTGKWSGPGATKIGVYIAGVWYLDPVLFRRRFDRSCCSYRRLDRQRDE